MNKLIFIIGLICCISLYAQNPNVNSVGGTLDHGETVTIDGSNFGSKSTPAPLKFDQFEDGTPGNDLSGWVVKKNTDWDQSVYPKYTGSANHTAVNGNSYTPPLRPNSARSVVTDFTGEYQYNCSFGLDRSQLFGDYMLVSFFAYIRTDMGSTTSDNFKMIRTYGSYSDGNPVWGITDQIQNSWCYIWAHSENDIHREQWNALDVKEDDGNWHQFTFLLKMNTFTGDSPNEDGVFIYRRDSNLSNSVSDVVHSDLGYGWKYLRIGHFVGGHSEGARQLNYFDNVYVDNTWASVMIGENSNFSNCDTLEYCEPTSWSDTHIEVVFNAGAFKSKQNVYLFVRNEYNNISGGYSIVIDEVNPVNTSAYVVEHPQDVTVQENDDAVFRVIAGGTLPISYQWQRNIGSGWNNIVGATGSTHTEYDCQLSEDGDLFRCYVENEYGNDTSNAAELSVQAESVPKAEEKMTIYEITKQPK